MRSGAELADDHGHSASELEAIEEKNDMIALNSEAEEEESQLISSSSEVEKEKEVKNAELKDSSKMDGLRRSKRTVKDPFWMKDYTTGKGTRKGKK